ncbi:MAG: AAA family ATPase, partial [Proteobacteria bacterium]|nr:AAA family ATPase [Pseudomonadota bacterium]
MKKRFDIDLKKQKNIFDKKSPEKTIKSDISKPKIYKHEHLLFDQPENPGLFDLSSHKRAKEAMDFALKMREQQFHVIVIGEDRSGRMSSTLAYLEQSVKSMKAPDDWVYVNNFAQTYKPIPYKLPNGMGIILKKKFLELILQINILINRLLNSSSYLKVIESLNAQIQFNIDHDFRSLAEFAQSKGFKIEQTSEGFTVDPLDDNMKNHVEDLSLIREKLGKVTLDASLASQELNRTINEFRYQNLKKAFQPLFDRFKKKFQEYLNDWIDLLEEDILNNIDLFLNMEDLGSPKSSKELNDRYTINVLVDNTGVKHPRVFLEANPTFDTIFGTIQYMTNPLQGVVETNFSMIKPGALHLANGGFLVLRVDAILKDPDLWNALKSALRDKRIRIFEKHRENTLPILDAPEPKSIALDIQVFLITSPFIYYNFLYADPDLESYFKIKAEIDSDMETTEENIKAYSNLISVYIKNKLKTSITKGAIKKLLNLSSRLTENKKRLSAQFEIILDHVDQAHVLKGDKSIIDEESVEEALNLRTKRHCRYEEKSFLDIDQNLILIDTEGEKIGQINGLTVISIADHEFGMPSRITAQTYMSDKGIINIERMTEMGGAIQQKGAFILEGFLNGLFAQNFPLCFGCSLTFEQAYGEVDGDSASVAELMAILSSFARWPIRQDIAITGSMNQFGQVQAVGGVYAKVEGFYKLCKRRGLTGKQGVIIPYSNL